MFPRSKASILPSPFQDVEMTAMSCLIVCVLVPRASVLSQPLENPKLFFVGSDGAHVFPTCENYHKSGRNSSGDRMPYYFQIVEHF